MAKKMPIAVLISRQGRTLLNLLKKIKADELDVEIKLVIASTSSASGLQYAEMENIPIEVIESFNYDSEEEFSEAVFQPCRDMRVEYVVMAGYLQYLRIPEDFHRRVVNVHPSLLPSFNYFNEAEGRKVFGRSVHEEVLRHGVKVSGCTVHFLDNDPRKGAIILQMPVDVLEDDTIDSLSDRVLNDAEFVAYPIALQYLAERRVQVEEATFDGETREVARILPKTI